MILYLTLFNLPGLGRAINIARQWHWQCRDRILHSLSRVARLHRVTRQLFQRDLRSHRS